MNTYTIIALALSWLAILALFLWLLIHDGAKLQRRAQLPRRYYGDLVRFKRGQVFRGRLAPGKK